MRSIVQISPEIGPGSGVAGVAHNLEEQWLARGVEVTRFTLREAHGAWIPRPGAGIRGKLLLLLQVVWFSTVGTWLVRRLLRRRPDLVAVCHNDALAGDVYVNHGNLVAAMRSRGRFWLRMARNPLHLFTAVRDRRRYGPAGPHRLVVNLTSAEDTLLRSTYPALATPTSVIGNGVDLDHFRAPDAAARRHARADMGLAEETCALLFIGHEHDRKGLSQSLDALALLPADHHLFVVGGTSDMVDAAGAAARRLGVLDRVTFTGPQPDPRPWLRAADVFLLPSAYESYGLVLLEALASGVPVVSTPTGCAPDVVRDGCNGVLVDRTGSAIAAGVTRLRGTDRATLSHAARASAEEHGWGAVAERYLAAIDGLATTAGQVTT